MRTLDDQMSRNEMWFLIAGLAVVVLIVTTVVLLPPSPPPASTLILEQDGVKVYRFYDEGKYRYLAVKGDSVSIK